jgi:hypothetical protein
MEILIGLLVVTVLVIGWGYGSLAVTIFLTVGDLVGLAILGLFRNPSLQLFAVASVLVIWAPIVIRRLWFVVRPVHKFVDAPVNGPAGEQRLTLMHQERPGDWQ